MKRLFSKTILATLIISLVPAQSVQAKPTLSEVGAMVGYGLLGGLIGNCIGKYFHDSYRQRTENKTRGLNLIINAANQQFSNDIWQANQPNPNGQWNNKRIREVVMSRELALSNHESNILFSLIKQYIRNAETRTKQSIITFCKTRIPADPQYVARQARIELSIFGGICGFIYGWLNK